jgi:hypothetical protein
MFGSFNPVRPLPLTLVTPSLFIQGTVQARVRRLTDLLRDADSDLLTVGDAKFIEIGSHRIVGNAAVGQVALSDVLMVHTTVSTEGTEELRTSKQPIKVLLLAPPFSVDGLIHLSYEPDLSVAMGALTERWVPVTGARYWAYGVAEEPVGVDLLVVNHDKVHVVVPRGTEWGPGSAPAGDVRPAPGGGW